MGVQLRFHRLEKVVCGSNAGTYQGISTQVQGNPNHILHKSPPLSYKTRVQLHYSLVQSGTASFFSQKIMKSDIVEFIRLDQDHQACCQADYEQDKAGSADCYPDSGHGQGDYAQKA